MGLWWVALAIRRLIWSNHLVPAEVLHAFFQLHVIQASLSDIPPWYKAGAGEMGWQAYNVHRHVETEMSLMHLMGKRWGRSGDNVLGVLLCLINPTEAGLHARFEDHEQET